MAQRKLLIPSCQGLDWLLKYSTEDCIGEDCIGVKYLDEVQILDVAAGAPWWSPPLSWVSKDVDEQANSKTDITR